MSLFIRLGITSNKFNRNEIMDDYIELLNVQPYVWFGIDLLHTGLRKEKKVEFRRRLTEIGFIELLISMSTLGGENNKIHYIANVIDFRTDRTPFKSPEPNMTPRILSSSKTRIWLKVDDIQKTTKFNTTDYFLESSGDKLNKHLLSSSMKFGYISRRDFPTYNHSWIMNSPNEVIKKVDFSCFRYNGTNVPSIFTSFFPIELLNNNRHDQFIIQHDSIPYKIRIERDKLNRIRIFWQSDLADKLIKAFPNFNYKRKPNSNELDVGYIVFIKDQYSKYHMFFSNTPHNQFDVLSHLTFENSSDSDNSSDADTSNDIDNLNDQENLFEGAKKTIKVNAYERNPKARKDALAIHGYSCKACEFNFESTYGEIGRNFIHVHHLIDISTIGEEYQVNPETDLVPVCPNCHAMLHRSRPAMKIEELKEKILMQRS